MKMNATDVTDNLSPEESLTPIQLEVLKQVQDSKTYELKNGMTVTFQKPSGIISTKIAELLGVNSINPAMQMQYRMLFNVAAINGDPVRTPTSPMQIEALISRFKDEETFTEVLFKYHQWAGILDEEGNPVISGGFDAAKK